MLADKNILHFKHEILYQVARLALRAILKKDVTHCLMSL